VTGPSQAWSGPRNGPQKRVQRTTKCPKKETAKWKGESGVLGAGGGQGHKKKADVPALPESMFETPPLEINLLRKASSYAREVVCNVSSFSESTFRSSLQVFKTRLGFLGNLHSPRIRSPTRWKFNTHGMTSTDCVSQSACHNSILERLNSGCTIHCQNANYATVHRTFRVARRVGPHNY
jgi:hypothetical protein